MCQVHRYTCIASVRPICGYVEGHLCVELCDVVTYTCLFINKDLYIVPRRTVGGAQPQGMMEP